MNAFSRYMCLLALAAAAGLLSAGGGVAVALPAQVQAHTGLKYPGSDKPPSCEKPLIGILAQACHYCPGRSYVAAGFVKWIEAAGARAVPIKYYSSEPELHRLFKSVNGLIFPGGLTDLWVDSPYVKAARTLWRWAMEANDKGDVFPIHGTCLGFQLLHILEVNISFVDLLTPTDSVSHATTLDFAPAAKGSTLFGGMDQGLLSKLSDPAYNISMENHMFGLLPSRYDELPLLKEKFDILTTTKDRQGVEYVSTVEHRQYPFFGTQWHPEKPPYEFGGRNIPHTMESIMVSQHLGHAFVDLARRSSHRPVSQEEALEAMIYNTSPHFTLKSSIMTSYDGPDQVYFFDTPDDEPPENWGHNRPLGRRAGPGPGSAYGMARASHAGSATVLRPGDQPEPALLQPEWLEHPL